MAMYAINKRIGLDTGCSLSTRVATLSAHSEWTRYLQCNDHRNVVSRTKQFACLVLGNCVDYGMVKSVWLTGW